jgi:hypothetical protein
MTTLTVNAPNDLDQDFAYQPLPPGGVIGDVLWHDVNGNGVKDPGELPLVDVTVILTLPDGSTQSTLTDASGQYLFTGLELGDYTVTVDTSTLPAGKVLTPSYDPDGNADSTSAVTLSAADSDNRDQDFGYEPVLYDYGDAPDGFGTYDTSGGPAHAISISLTLGTGVTSDANGQPGRPADGDVDDGVTAVLQPGELPDVSVTVTNDTNEDAYVYGYLDLNGDGDWTDPGETAMVLVLANSGTGTYTMPFTGIVTIANIDDPVYGRFRLSTDEAAVSVPTGTIAPNGEVEDYVFTLQPTAIQLNTTGSSTSWMTVAFALSAVVGLMLITVKIRPNRD